MSGGPPVTPCPARSLCLPPLHSPLSLSLSLSIKTVFEIRIFCDIFLEPEVLLFSLFLSVTRKMEPLSVNPSVEIQEVQAFVKM